MTAARRAAATRATSDDGEQRQRGPKGNLEGIDEGEGWWIDLHDGGIHGSMVERHSRLRAGARIQV